MRFIKTQQHPVKRFSRALEFFRCDDAVAAVEFAIVLPFLISLGLGVNEYCRFMLLAKRVTTAADSIAQMASSTKGSLSPGELNNFEKSVITMPQLSRDAAAASEHYWGVARVNISSIRFKALYSGCTVSACPHDAYVLWAWGWDRRTCGKLTPVDDSATPSPKTIPRSLVDTGSVVSVEMSYRYTPIIGAGLFPGVTIKRHAYYKPRYLPFTDLVPISNAGLPVERCAGV